MNGILFALYILIAALWVGGIALFTFIVTPAIFRSFNRDAAGRVVGKIFPGYYAYLCILSILASVVFFLGSPDGSSAARLSVVLLPVAVLVNLFIVFRLHPEMARVKLAISSFEREPSDSGPRDRFRKLHAVSAVLNLLQLGAGTALLIAGLFL